MPNELKPCPFCGRKATIYTRKVKNEFWHNFNYKYKAKCTRCNANIGEYEYRNNAIEAWNRRFDNAEN